MVRYLEVANIVVDQLFFPVEHLAWARDAKLLQGSSSPFWHASLLLWAASLVLTILRLDHSTTIVIASLFVSFSKKCCS